MKPINYALALLALALLVACSTTQPATQTNPDDSNPNAIMTETSFKTYLTDMGQDLQAVLTESDLGLALLTAVPRSGPIDGLTGLANLGDIQDSNLILNDLTDLILQGRGSVNLDLRTTDLIGFELARGYWQYSNELDSWHLVHGSDDLILAFPFSNLDGTTSHIVITIDWNALATTVPAKDISGRSLEVPRGVRITLEKDGIQAGYLEIKSEWVNSCGYRVLEPKSVMIDGNFNHSGSDDHLTLDIDIMAHDADGLKDSISTEATLMFKSGNDSVKLAWDLSADVDFHRNHACFTEILAVNEGEAHASLEVSYRDYKYRLGITLEHGHISMVDTFALHDVRGHFDVDGNKAISFQGTLGDSNRNGVPGENLWLSYEDGTRSTLEALLSEFTHLN